MLNYLSERPRNVLLCCAWGWWGSTSALKKSLGGPKFAQKDSTPPRLCPKMCGFYLGCKFRWENRWLSLSCGCPTFKSWNAIELASSAPSSIWRGLLALLRRASSPVCFYLQKAIIFTTGLRILRNGGTRRGTSGTLVNRKLWLVPQFPYKNHNFGEVPQFPYWIKRGTNCV